jgi:SAM-dependent methyltransferase
MTSRRRDIHSLRPWNQFAYPSAALRSAIEEMVADAHLGQGSVVLDLGCADRPYRDVFGPGVQYVGADLPGNDDADIDIAPDGTVPSRAATYDLILSTQVLEHVERPERYLAECRRLLKPTGRLLLTTHGVMYYHRDPEDYWRWTVPGLRLLFKNSGLTVIDNVGVLGLAAAAVQIFQDETCWKLPRPLRRLYVLFMQGVVALIDKLYSPQRRQNSSWTIAVTASPTPRPADEKSGPTAS